MCEYLNVIDVKYAFAAEDCTRVIRKINYDEQTSSFVGFKPDTPLRPIVASLHAPTTNISKFLNNPLAPLSVKVASETTFINGIDLVRKLEKYVVNGYLTPATKFVTADVANLYTIILRTGALETSMRFLEKFTTLGKIGTFTIDHITKMPRVILDNNYFVYGNKYYRQIRDGAVDSEFTQVLSNVYMLEREHNLIEDQNTNKELYRRYIDEIFMTMNLSDEKIKEKPEKAKIKDTNIDIEYKISRCVDFLDVVVQNEDDHLRTSIYHKPSAEPYILPYTSDHPHHIHRNIPYAALLRAARICSDVHDIDVKRIRIDLSLLLNNYPSKFISQHFQRFFQLNNAMMILKKLDEQVYHHLHQKLLHQPSRRETQLKIMMNDLDNIPRNLKTKPWNRKIICPQFIFETGPLRRYLHTALQQWWRKWYASPRSLIANVKVMRSIKFNRTLEILLIQKKQSKQLLQKLD